jgi:hypothetical protein
VSFWVFSNTTTRPIPSPQLGLLAGSQNPQGLLERTRHWPGGKGNSSPSEILKSDICAPTTGLPVAEIANEQLMANRKPNRVVRCWRRFGRFSMLTIPTSYKIVINSRSSDFDQYPHPEPPCLTLPTPTNYDAHHTHTSWVSNLRQRSSDF